MKFILITIDSEGLISALYCFRLFRSSDLGEKLNTEMCFQNIQSRAKRVVPTRVTCWLMRLACLRSVQRFSQFRFLNEHQRKEASIASLYELGWARIRPTNIQRMYGDVAGSILRGPYKNMASYCDRKILSDERLEETEEPELLT